MKKLLLTLALAVLGGLAVSPVRGETVRRQVVPAVSSSATPPAGTRTALVAEAFPAEAGTVTGGGTYVAGQVVPVFATPREHYQFSHWSGARVVNPSSAGTKVYIPRAAQRLVAVFSPVKYPLTITVDPPGAGTTLGGGFVPHGASAPLVARPGAGFVFAGWDGPVAAPGEASTALARPMSAPMTLVARFKPESKNVRLDVQVKPDSAGTVLGAGVFPQGARVPLRAAPAPGYRFERWEGAVTRPGDLESVASVVEDTVITAHFALQPGWVRAQVMPAGGGRIEGDVGTQPGGKICKIKALPHEGYRFDHWEGEVADASIPDTTLVPAAGKISSVRARFKPAFSSKDLKSK